MARWLLLLYLMIVFGPLLAASLAFSLRDRLPSRRRGASSLGGNGHRRRRRLAETVEEVRPVGGA